MVTFLERATIGLPYALFVFKCIVSLVISYYGFVGGALVQFASVPGHCLSSTF